MQKMRTIAEIFIRSPGKVQVISKPPLREVLNMVNPFGTPCSKWGRNRFAGKSSTSTPKKTAVD